MHHQLLISRDGGCSAVPYSNHEDGEFVKLFKCLSAAILLGDSRAGSLQCDTIST